MMILSVHNLTKYFGERALFSGLSFDVGERDKIGLVGDNGCGKTTLFKLLTREFPADGGEAVRSKEARIGYMEQHACADPSRTLWDEVESVFAPVAAMERELESVRRELEEGPPAAPERPHPQTAAGRRSPWPDFPPSAPRCR